MSLRKDWPCRGQKLAPDVRVRCALYDRSVDDVHLSPEKCRDLIAHVNLVEEIKIIDGGTCFELCQEIDVALRPEIFPQDRAEYV